MLRPNGARGFTLVELLVGISITAAAIMLGLPSFASWLQNTQIRTAAESVQNGVQLARAEAVRHNAPVMFQLTTSLDSSCVLVTTGTASTSSNWVISMDSAVSHCDAAPSADLAAPVSPRVVQKRAGGDGSKNATVNVTDRASITFNGLGRLASTTPGMTVTIGNSTGACGPTGPMRCLKLIVSPVGQTLLCDPQATAGTPQACS
jgi:type IV fimbrial biogenesis protein FimT